MVLRKSILSKRRVRLFAFLSIVFVFILMWACIQPLNSSPDEGMRYDIVRFIINHGYIPDGRDPEIRSQIWGISYAFYPIISYMIMAIPAKLVSLFTTDAFACVIAARVVNAIFGTITAYLVVRISEMLFCGRERYLFTALVVFLPGVVFVQSYVNNDAMALLATAWIIYVWTRAIKEGWTWGLCIHLSFAIAVCALSYYNAYGFILCSIIFFFTTILASNSEKNKAKYVISRTVLIVILVLALAGWWFVRNYILYGDFTGWNVTTQYSEMYAMDGYKPSQRDNLAQKGINFFKLLTLRKNDSLPWIIIVIRGYIGTFGYLNIYMPLLLTAVYALIIGIGAVGFFLCLRDTFKLKASDKENGRLGKKGIFNWCMLIAIIITFAFLVYYNLYSDFQAQGRYLIPMTIPLMYFITLGIQRLMNLFVKRKKIQNIIYSVICILIIVCTALVYIVTVYPAYTSL